MFLFKSPFNDISWELEIVHNVIFTQQKLSNATVNVDQHTTAYDSPLASPNPSSFLLFFPAVLGFYYFCFICEKACLYIFPFFWVKKCDSGIYYLLKEGQQRTWTLKTIILILWLLSCFPNPIFIITKRTHLSQDSKLFQIPN